MTRQTISKPSNPFIITALIVSFVMMTSCSSENEEPSEKDISAVDETTAPIGEVAVADTNTDETTDIAATDEGNDMKEPAAEAAAAPSASGGKGKEIYDGVCFACHAEGLAGAPKLGDQEAWTARIDKGNDTLYDHSINGFTGESGSMMPPKGGRADIADDDIKAAVDYMIEAVGGAVATPAAAAATEAEPVATAEAGGDSGKGKEIYDSTCLVCHATGVAGAPKLGDAEAWGPRIAQGNDTLYDHAINGFMGAGMMPPKGGKADLSDDDVKAAVDYMVAGSQ